MGQTKQFDWLDRTDQVRDRLVEEYADGLDGSRAWFSTQADELCDSPIEKLLLTAWLMTLAEDRNCSSILRYPGTIMMGFQGPCPSTGRQDPLEFYEVCAQFPVGSFRVDLMFWNCSYTSDTDRSESRVAVECDGHDFHERSKEQAENDKARQRLIQLSGVPVLRFTGSEIWRDPRKCVEQIREFLAMETSKSQKRTNADPF